MNKEEKTIYKVAEEIVFQNNIPRYKTDIESDRKNNKDSRLLDKHVASVEFTVRMLEMKSSVVPPENKQSSTVTATTTHASPPSESIQSQQENPHNIDLGWD